MCFKPEKKKTVYLYMNHLGNWFGRGEKKKIEIDKHELELQLNLLLTDGEFRCGPRTQNQA